MSGPVSHSGGGALLASPNDGTTMEATIRISDDGRVVTIFGVNYDIELFRHLGIGPIGSRIEIIGRADGVVTLKRLP